MHSKCRSFLEGCDLQNGTSTPCTGGGGGAMIVVDVVIVCGLLF